MNRLFTIILILSAVVFSGKSINFLSSAESEQLFTIGVRGGVNTSNRTLSNKTSADYSYNSWGTGFTAGVVADLNIRDYLAIQPGVFFESRSGHVSYVGEWFTESGDPYYVGQETHRHSYNLTIPVLASFRFNLSGRLRWHLDFGPYVAFVLKSKLENKELISTRPDLSNHPSFDAKFAPVDFGFKMGTGLEISRHLYFGIHYEAGAVKAYRDQNLGDGLQRVYGGRTKAWNFTVGWNF